MGDPDWQHTAFIDGLHRIFVGALEEIVACGNPRHITPQMSSEIAQLFHMVVYRQMEHRGWKFGPPR